MLNIQVYDYNHYRPLLAAVLGKGRTGKRLALAKHMGCPASHISQVLKEKTHLSLEQGEKTCRFLHFSKMETKYFLNLIHHDRAGTQELRAIYKQALEEDKEKFLSVSGRLKTGIELPDSVQAQYYSSWVYLAVHLATHLPALKTRADIAAFLRISEEQAAIALDFLVEHGILSLTKEGYQSGRFNVFLDKTSPHLNNHHFNWRAKAMEKILMRQESNLHYSSAFTVSRAGMAKIKQDILALIESNVETIRSSTEEEGLHAFIVDFFHV